jgi:hypothetical protein
MNDDEVGRYVEALERGEVPVDAPSALLSSEWYGDGLHGHRDRAVRATWPCLAGSWIDRLAGFLVGRRVLEIMAGSGLLARELAARGLEVRATDSGTWRTFSDGPMRGHPFFYPVEIHEAKAAVVSNPDAQALVVSWPPYHDESASAALKAWKRRGPVAYVGELGEGCNATERFFKTLYAGYDLEEVAIPQWPGLHDVLALARPKR